MNKNLLIFIVSVVVFLAAAFCWSVRTGLMCTMIVGALAAVSSIIAITINESDC